MASELFRNYINNFSNLDETCRAVAINVFISGHELSSWGLTSINGDDYTSFLHVLSNIMPFVMRQLAQYRSTDLSNLQKRQIATHIIAGSYVAAGFTRFTSTQVSGLEPIVTLAWKMNQLDTITVDSIWAPVEDVMSRCCGLKQKTLIRTEPRPNYRPLPSVTQAP